MENPQIQQASSEILKNEIEMIRARQAAEFALTPAGQQLQRFQSNQRMGQMYAQSTLVPAAYQGNIANCAIAVDMATRMNANALMVMQNLYIVHGNPSWSSKFLISTINTCGRFEPLRYRFFEDGTIGKVEYWDTDWVNGKKVNVKKIFDGTKIKNLCCVAYTRAKGSDDILESSIVSCRMAALEGWWTKNQSKWPTMTQQMLMYRAAAFWQRTYAPEISMGFSTVEEQTDIVDVDYEDLRPGMLTAAAPAEPAAEPEPAAPTQTNDTAPRRTMAEMARENARRAMQAATRQQQPDTTGQINTDTGEILDNQPEPTDKPTPDETPAQAPTE